jgi:hypothetical protein
MTQEETVESREKTHLLYIEDNGRMFMREHFVGAAHPQEAVWYAPVPKVDDARWREGKPNGVGNEQGVTFLTLCPFYPSGRLDVSCEQTYTHGLVARYPNHPTFAGCQKFMDKQDLIEDWRPIAKKDLSLAIYTVAMTHPWKNINSIVKEIEVYADSEVQAYKKGVELLGRDTIGTVRLLREKTKPNPDYMDYQKQMQERKIPLTVEEIKYFQDKQATSKGKRVRPS